MAAEIDRHGSGVASINPDMPPVKQEVASLTIARVPAGMALAGPVAVVDSPRASCEAPTPHVGRFRRPRAPEALASHVGTSPILGRGSAAR